MTTESKPHVSKLHELLAALNDNDSRSKRVQQEAVDTFTKKANHFMGMDKTLHMFDEKDANLEPANAQHQILTTTVGAKLGYIKKDIIRWYDAFLQKEATNQDARADFIVDGTAIAKNLPAGFFLGMEKELKALRSVYESIPTLQPGIKWEEDKTLSAQDNSKGVYRNANPVKKLKTVKTIEHKVLVPADEHHPAQITEWSENIPVGEFTEETFCGMLTPADKSAMLQRITKLIAAVRKARMRANTTEVKKMYVGKAIFKYIHSTDSVSDTDDE